MSYWCVIHDFEGKQVLLTNTVQSVNEGASRRFFRTYFYTADFDANSTESEVTVLSDGIEDTEEKSLGDWELYAEKAVTEARIKDFIKFQHSNA